MAEQTEYVVYGVIENSPDSHKLEFVARTFEPRAIYPDGNYEALVAFPVETMVQLDDAGEHVGEPGPDHGGIEWALGVRSERGRG